MLVAGAALLSNPSMFSLADGGTTLETLERKLDSDGGAEGAEVDESQEVADDENQLLSVAGAGAGVGVLEGGVGGGAAVSQLSNSSPVALDPMAVDRRAVLSR